MSHYGGGQRNKAELDFALLLDDVIWSSFRQDVFEHWDIAGVLRDVTAESYRYDVKGMRRNARAGRIDPDITWVESKNVRGRPGWVYGKADYIAFEQPEPWVIVDRTRLVGFMRDKIADNGSALVEHAKDALYRLYSRKNRADVISKALMADIRDIARWEVAKA